MTTPASKWLQAGLRVQETVQLQVNEISATTTQTSLDTNLNFKLYVNNFNLYGNIRIIVLAQSVNSHTKINSANQTEKSK